MNSILKYCLLTLLLMSSVTHAELKDEIQVYTDDINAPGNFGLELHVNTTPNGRRTPGYPGEVVSHRGWRITPELSYGLSESFDAGLYIPSNRDQSGRIALAGAKVRLRWLPITGGEKVGGWYLGVNGELSRVRREFSESRSSAELRIMTGYRSEEWLVGLNSVFGWNLSDGLREKSADLGLAFKASRKVSSRISLGTEYYTDLGTTARLLPSENQAKTLYLVADIDTKPVGLNFGFGRGLNGAADKWTVKAIFEIEI